MRFSTLRPRAPLRLLDKVTNVRWLSSGDRLRLGHENIIESHRCVTKKFEPGNSLLILLVAIITNSRPDFIKFKSLCSLIISIVPIWEAPVWCNNNGWDYSIPRAENYDDWNSAELKSTPISIHAIHIFNALFYHIYIYVLFFRSFYTLYFRNIFNFFCARYITERKEKQFFSAFCSL